MNERADDLAVTIVCPDGGSIKFGPLREGPGSISACDFLLGPIVVVDAAGATETLDDRNGIEALALANFRDDLEQMLEHGHGLVFFGDHDFGQIADHSPRCRAGLGEPRIPGSLRHHRGRARGVLAQ